MNNPTSKLHVSIEGKGPNLVLLHGFLESNEMWAPLQLESNFTCIKIELPGHGESDVENVEKTIAFMAKCVKTTLDSIAIHDFHFLGHSMGGYVALEFVANFDWSGQLVLLHSNFWEDDEKKKLDRQRVADIVMENKNLFLQEAIPALFLAPKMHFVAINSLLTSAKKMKASAIAESALSMQKRRNHRDLLLQYPNKIALVQGEEDKLVPLSVMKEKFFGLKNELIVIPSVGHMGQYENSSVIRQVLLDLFSKKNGHF